ncbi:hypothetical protein AG1IA_06686 [Rhizoctonia solani AG-1 IA]|uniref:Uncharacterized protein n=1 Tax=Thanatephorus cucumeris (strain AG1-IA) TaxID=983506 RepID=L8WMX3_THACA|nr:hypothetical protein AG1IA_06686 [Rhizoctonia solani AG-1 IA]
MSVARGAALPVVQRAEAARLERGIRGVATLILKDLSSTFKGSATRSIFTTTMSKSTRRPPKLSPALFSAAVGAGAPTGGLPPSPSAQNPTEVHDAHVELASPGALLKWKNEAGGVYGPKIKSVVLALPANAASKDVLGRSVAIITIPTESGIIALSIPYPLSGPPPELTAPVPIAYSFTFKQSSDALVEALRWASDKHPVDIDVQVDLINDEQGWDALEELISKVVSDPDQQKGEADSVSQPKPNLKPIVLCGSPDIGIHKYKLIDPLLCSQFAPSPWCPRGPDRQIAHPSDVPGIPGTYREEGMETKDQDVPCVPDILLLATMITHKTLPVGPAIEAFGYSRLVFGSSPSTTSTSTSNAGDWYQIAKESVAELGVDQEGLDAVFGTNAKTIYGQ